MIIYLDGPQASALNGFADELLTVFDTSRGSILLPGSSPTVGKLTNYQTAVIEMADSPNVMILRRGWVQDYVRAMVQDVTRLHQDDYFMNEWLYRRPFIGRGGSFIILDEEPVADTGEDEMSPDVEDIRFSHYASRCGYATLILPPFQENWITDANSHKVRVTNWDQHVTRAASSAFLRIHKVPTTQYLGPIEPRVTLVGDSANEFSFVQRPFLDRTSAEFLRPFGMTAIHYFGYTSLAAFKSLPQHLCSQPVMVGNRASAEYPDYPSTIGIDREAGPSGRRRFRDGLQIALAHYRSKK